MQKAESYRREDDFTYFNVFPRNIAHKTSRTRIGLEARAVLAVLDYAVLE